MSIEPEKSGPEAHLHRFFQANLSQFEGLNPGVRISFVRSEELREAILSRLSGSIGMPPETTPLNIQSVLMGSCRWLSLDRFSLGHLSDNTVKQGLELLGIKAADDVYLIWVRANVIEKAPLSALSGKSLNDLGGVEVEDLIIYDTKGRWAASTTDTFGFGATKLQKHGSGRYHQGSNSNLYVHPTEALLSAHDLASKTTFIRGIEFVNFSPLSISQLYNWFPWKLSAEKVVFFPDVTPVQSAKKIPTGTAVLTRDPQWRRFAVADVGCGMQLLKSRLSLDDFCKSDWDQLGSKMKANRGRLGDLGGGNHFVDAIVSQKDGALYFLVHTGSRTESFSVERFINNPDRFDAEYERVVNWAQANRNEVADTVRSVFGRCEEVCDLVHNFYEHQKDGSVLIRKGTIRATPGSIAIVPSHMTGDISLLRASPNVIHALDSLCHGTGRAISRTEARLTTTDADIRSARKAVFIPDFISDNSIRPHIPKNYRDLSECLEYISPLVSELERFSVLGFIGHL